MFSSNNTYFKLGALFGGAMVSATAVIVIRDVAWYFFDKNTHNQTKTTQICYDWFEHYIPNTDNRQIDYSEGLFDFEKPEMTLEEATTRKYEHIFNQLNLQPGMRLLDAGCGSGVWLEFCQKRGVLATGLTLSPEQAKKCRSKGLDVRVCDYRILNQDFLGKFDAVTALGSSEHVCSSRGSRSGENMARLRTIDTFTNVWSLFNSYLKDNGKLYVTTLTINDVRQSKSLMLDSLKWWVLDKHYGGMYPRWGDIRDKIVPQIGMELTDCQDKTKDYHWSSMVEPRHFGNFKIYWRENTLDKLLNIFTDLLFNPLHFPFHWAYYNMNVWMWHLGGVQNEPLSDEQIKNSPAQLKYFMLSKSKSQDEESSTRPETAVVAMKFSKVV